MQASQDKTELNFEQSLAALEKIVESMSNQDLSLEKMIELYEQGIEYLQLCQKNMEVAEMKVNMLNQRLKEKACQEPSDG
ncbi:MAG TPA: exodeoxyribonuclease VII small subunit [Candidatus Syntrophosphaera sp.]|nr:exodeoxyribonuclease VII small subunit [Candidatus Syntrophosphaera sp.]